ncbi:MAG: hypothetical protein WB679_08920 [Terracidiphilus sp.]
MTCRSAASLTRRSAGGTGMRRQMLLLERFQSGAAGLRETVLGETQCGEFYYVGLAELTLRDNSTERIALPLRSVEGPEQD